MMMPQMSGTEVLEQIRKVDTDVAVIVSTAYPTVETAVASLKAQASDYVEEADRPAGRSWTRCATRWRRRASRRTRRRTCTAPSAAPSATRARPRTSR